MTTRELREHIAEGCLQFPLRVSPNGERFADRRAKPLNGIGRARAEQPCVGPKHQKLREGEILFLKTQPPRSMPEVGVLDFVFGVAGQFDGRRPPVLNAELNQNGAAARFEDSPQLRQKANGAQVSDMCWASTDMNTRSGNRKEPPCNGSFFFPLILVKS